MSRSYVIIKQADSTSFDRPILRVLQTPNQLLVVTGTDCSDHDVWSITGAKAELTGVLNATPFQRVSKTKTKETVTLSPTDFEWLNPETEKPFEPVAGTVVTARMAKICGITVTA